LIDGINQSLTRVQNTSQDILSLSKELSKIARQTTRPDPPKYDPAPMNQNSAGEKPSPLFPRIGADKAPERPVTANYLELAVEKINQITEYKIFKTDLPEKEVFHRLLNQSNLEQDEPFLKFD
ncbi:MAG: hypothetical protein LBG25_00855, partial [Spirochaetaceae bacterium]|nr:hypothetical protein [Spirochaetaceae bacterium]